MTNNLIITTNLRIPKSDWLQIKAMAGELGLSVNEYVNYLIRKVSVKQELIEDWGGKWEDLPIWNLSKIPGNKGQELSEEDKIIYG